MGKEIVMITDIDESIKRLNDLYIKAMQQGQIKTAIQAQVQRSKLMLVKEKNNPKQVIVDTYQHLDVLRKLYNGVDSAQDLCRVAATQIVKGRSK